MRLHSIANKVYYPESYGDLKKLGTIIKDSVILAAGSNVILPPHLYRPVVSLMKLNEKIELLENGRVKVGCSVRVQKLIGFLKDNHLGGIEYLYSVPASVGGLVYMNGGRGKNMNMSISDYLETVEYLDLKNMKVHIYQKNPKDFSYRYSVFQKMPVIILSCVFIFKEQDPTITENLIKERLAYSKERLSSDKPSCGSVFCKGNRVVYRLLRGMRVGGAIFSKKTPNWISNVDNATYEDVCMLIKRAQTVHKFFLSSCRPEVIIIKK